ncbi:MAG TPA: sugar phosphate isomerase/epimerase [Mucilaginibacter sp.]|jgi:sugar phosphate isomerase/epimerase|nr:sugar phosphate isomerase/epimerase [Mucilaginibacter sp.]
MSNRRTFLKNTSLLALSVPLAKIDLFDTTAHKISAFGIQLYMVRDEMAEDMPGTLKKIGEMGYTQLESFGGDKGMFWGMNNRDFKKLSGDYGLTLVSSHYNDEPGGFEKQVEKAAEIGMKYLICPWKGPQKSIDKFKQFAEEFNHNGEICKKYGMRFGYHPHDYPYKKVDGQLPIDVLLNNTDKNLVDFEMDFYYTVTEGQNPEAYIKKYSGRFKLCHMRDVLKHRLPPGSTEESACDLGRGIINYPHLLATGLDNGMKYFFVEQSRFFHETPLQSAKINIDYLKKLQLA